MSDGDSFDWVTAREVQAECVWQFNQARSDLDQAQTQGIELNSSGVTDRLDHQFRSASSSQYAAAWSSKRKALAQKPLTPVLSPQ